MTGKVKAYIQIHIWNFKYPWMKLLINKRLISKWKIVDKCFKLSFNQIIV